MGMIKSLQQKTKALKEELIALSLSYNDRRTPWYAKAMIGLTIGYALSPIDLIPDFIPIIGYLDDLIILPAMVLISIKMIPSEVLTECRRRAKDGDGINKRIGWYAAILILLFWIFAVGWIFNTIFWH